jgi:hypothetical protein
LQQMKLLLTIGIKTSSSVNYVPNLCDTGLPYGSSYT